MRTTSSSRRVQRLSRPALCAGLILLALPSTQAAPQTWDNDLLDADANWSTVSNWVGGAFPGNINTATPSSDSAAFPSAATVEAPVLDIDIRISGLNFNNTEADYSLGRVGEAKLFIGSFTVTGGGVTTIAPEVRIIGDSQIWNTGATEFTLQNGLSIGGTVSAPALRLENTTPVVLQGPVSNQTTAGRSLMLRGAGSLHVTGDVSNGTGSFGFSSDGGANSFSGVLRLSGNNSFTGAMTWRSGTIEVASANALAASTSSIALASTTTGTFDASLLTTGEFTVPRNLTINSGAVNNITVGGSHTSGTSTYSGTFILTNKVGGVNLTAAQGGTVVFSNLLSGTVETQAIVTKIGAGTVALTRGNGNTYVGGTTVTEGNLLLSNATGSATGTGPVALSGGASATLSGTGSASGATTVTNGSRLAPGANTADADGSGRVNFGLAGTLRAGTSGGLTLTDAHLDFDLASTAAGVSDSLTTNALSLGSTIAFSFHGLGGVLETDVPYTLINASSDSGFAAENISTTFLGALAGAYTAVYSMNGTSDLQVTFTAVPEPGSALSLLGGLGMLAGWRRFRRGC